MSKPGQKTAYNKWIPKAGMVSQQQIWRFQIPDFMRHFTFNPVPASKQEKNNPTKNSHIKFCGIDSGHRHYINQFIMK
jgi:hypothetical protein